MGVPIPSVTIVPVEGAANVAQPNPAGAHITIGVCSLGSANNVYSAGNQNTLVGLVGYGPGPQSAAYDLDVAAGPAYVMPVNASVAGTTGPVWLGGPNSFRISNNGGGTNQMIAYQPSSGSVATSAVTHTGSGTGVIAQSGTPTVNAQMYIKITTAGSQTTAVYSVSLDGGVSFPIVNQTLAASQTINGLTVTATGAGATYVAGDVYWFTTVLHAATGPTTTLTLTGTPLPWTPQFLSGFYNLIIKVTTGGVVGTAIFSYSLDGGQTYPFGNLTTAATVPLGSTGLTANFGAGTYVATDLYQSIAVTTSPAGCGTLTVSGAPYDNYLVQVKIVASGQTLAAGTGTFQYSVDGGNSYSGTIAIPSGGTYLIPNTNMTLTFVNGTGNSTTSPSFIAGDVYTFAALAPGYATGDLTTALTAAYALNVPLFSYFHIVGRAASASASQAVFAALSSSIDGAWNQNQFYWAIMSAAQDSDANLETQFANDVDFRISVGGGQLYLSSPIDGNSYKRDVGWVVSGRCAGLNFGVDPAEFDLGPIPGASPPAGAQTALCRNEFLTPGLNAARFSTMMTFQGAQGFYLTNALTMESNSGSYPLVAQLRVLAAACQISYLTLLKFLSKGVRVNPSNAQAPLVPGGIDPRDAATINGTLQFALASSLLTPGQISGVLATVDQTTNVLATSALTVNVAVTGLAYIKSITCNVGFINPALSLPV